MTKYFGLKLRERHMFVTFTPMILALISMWYYGWINYLQALEGGWLLIAAVLAVAFIAGAVTALLLGRYFTQEWQQTLTATLMPFAGGELWQHTSTVQGGGHFQVSTREVLRIQIQTSPGSSHIQTISAHNEIRRTDETSAQLVTEVRKPVWAYAWLIAMFPEHERKFLQVPA